ncbi:unnamed protein product [Sphagnum troendelagicum]|uniref:Uncharacterized protein n=1 Tax=Sphagnum troendelagicum TaxID=128251 RepID=A0ABP0TQ89_9BRYO
MEPLYDTTSKYLRHLSYVTQQKNQIQAPINTPSLPSFSNPIRPYLVSTASSSSSFSSSSPAHFSTDSTRVCGHQTAWPSLQSRLKPTPALYDPGFRCDMMMKSGAEREKAKNSSKKSVENRVVVGKTAKS